MFSAIIHCIINTRNTFKIDIKNGVRVVITLYWILPKTVNWKQKSEVWEVEPEVIAIVFFALSFVFGMIIILFVELLCHMSLFSRLLSIWRSYCLYENNWLYHSSCLSPLNRRTICRTSPPLTVVLFTTGLNALKHSGRVNSYTPSVHVCT